MSTLQINSEAASAVHSYLDAFNELYGTLPGSSALRTVAINAFEETGFPGPRDEDWKFTSVAPIVRTAFLSPPTDNDPLTLTKPGTLPEGVIFSRLVAALSEHCTLVEPHLGTYADPVDHAFVALNTAFWKHGAFLYVPPDTVVNEPIHLSRLVSTTTPQGAYLHYHRVLIVLGRGSKATVVETYGGTTGEYATNAVVEIVVGENASLDHYKLQDESTGAFHLSCTQVEQAQHSRFSTHYIGFGGALVRNEVRVRFAGKGCETTVNGLYQAAGTQHMDNHTVIDHAMPHCASHELYKGVLDGKARGVFNGKIFVRQDAQKTDAKQTNKTLLLSDDAAINTKPQLEIYADDVKCTHGATVAQLDPTQLFYVRSRGVGTEEARALLTFAFANDIVSRIQVDSLRRQIEERLLVSRSLPRLESEFEESP
jgi:Fe-S cluster assembly protein SufD